MNNGYVLLQIITIAVVTFALRVLPFAVFKDQNRRPALITYLGNVLPYGVMAMLVVYCLKNVSVLAAPHGLPELIAICGVILLHLWRRSTLLSIFGGTAIYMVLVQFVFA